jgi:hypothetical protein
VYARAIGIQGDAGGLRPGELLLDLGDRRVAVEIGEAIDPEELRLESVPALGDVVAVHHCINQGLHGSIAGLIGEIATGHP